MKPASGPGHTAKWLVVVCLLWGPSTAFAGPCVDWAQRLPNLNYLACQAAKLLPSGKVSVKGAHLYQTDVRAPLVDALVEDAEKPPVRKRVLIIGGIHGDELSSSTLVIHWIKLAGETPGNVDWRFIPVLNPDALLMHLPTRTNANGVDLNRNFATPRWDRQALDYWAKRTKKDPRRWPGNQALSEPESRFVADTMVQWRPDLIVSVHAPRGVLDTDGPGAPISHLGRLTLDRGAAFPGGLGDYADAYRRIPVATFELPSALRTPSQIEIRQMWQDLFLWSRVRLSLGRR